MEHKNGNYITKLGTINSKIRNCDDITEQQIVRFGRKLDEKMISAEN